ncbi:MAG: hypothetical protein Q8M16_17215 [Pirellulaceae bacterium]|nr:hypothetical protein [Pirellulaceae bacterium]
MDLLHKPCPQFRAVDLDQKTIRAEDFRGRWLWLLFHRHLA